MNKFLDAVLSSPGSRRLKTKIVRKRKGSLTAHEFIKIGKNLYVTYSVTCLKQWGIRGKEMCFIGATRLNIKSETRVHLSVKLTIYLSGNSAHHLDMMEGDDCSVAYHFEHWR